MKGRKGEFDALIGAQGLAFRWGVRMRSRRCIIGHGVNLGAIGVIAMIIVTGTFAFPMLILSTEQGLARLIQI